MDKVQIFSVCIMAANIGLVFNRIAQFKTRREAINELIGTFILSTPIYGRIFNWW